MIGRTYLLHGELVTVLTHWCCPHPVASEVVLWLGPPKTAPRNVLIERADGSRTIRPFRGLRKACP